MSEIARNPDEVVKNRIVVDTDVFSYLLRKDSRADFFRPYFLHRTLALSFMSIGELYYGAYKGKWQSNRIIQLENAIRNYVVLPYDYKTCQQWAKVRTQLEATGQKISEPDVWVAACALHYDCALATNNGRHFNNITGLLVICPSLC